MSKISMFREDFVEELKILNNKDYLDLSSEERMELIGITVVNELSKIRKDIAEIRYVVIASLVMSLIAGLIYFISALTTLA